MRKTCTLLVVALMLAGSTAWAGGFLLYEHNSTATGMCGARAAIADDPSSMYYNPAGITELEGVQLQVGLTGILPGVHYEAAGRPAEPRTYATFDANGNPVVDTINDGENSVDGKIKGFNPIHLYATWRIPSIPLAIGYGLTNPFGLGTYWPGDWDGRFVGTETEIQTFFNNPVAALDIADLAGFKDTFKLSIAAGYMFVYGTARLAKRIDLKVAEAFSHGEFQDPWGEMRMKGSAIGHGWNVAVYGELPKLLSFGFSLRSGVSMPFEGTAKFVFPGEDNTGARALLASMGTVFPDETTGAVTIDLPMHLNAGVAFLGVDRLKVALDFYYAFFESYDALALHFACTDDGTCSEKLNKTVEKNWGASWQISLGGEYMITDYLPIRLGYGTVSSPVPAETYDPSLPDGQRQLITAGTGYHGSWWKLDLGYMLAFWKGTKDNDVGGGDDLNPEGKANGTYTTFTHLLGLTFTAKI